ncbi:hypothetical protein [Actinoplanes auranticolor]|nr:hypothetical protein [Actinoplanes auranticolor]
MSADFDIPADRGFGRAWFQEQAEYLARTGVIELVWNTYDGPPIADAELGDHLRELDVGAGLRAMPRLGVGGPALRPVSVPGVADGPEAAWDQLAEALGQPLPYWTIPLQQRRLIDAWQPGRPTVQALAVDPEMDLDVLLRLAALYDSDHPAAQVLVRLFRTVTWRESQAAAQMIASVESMTLDSTVVIAARPIPVPRADLDELAETVRRAGWLEILGRADVLADACVEQLVRWDGGRDCPFGAPVDLVAGDPISDEVIARLTPHPHGRIPVPRSTAGRRNIGRPGHRRPSHPHHQQGRRPHPDRHEPVASHDVAAGRARARRPDLDPDR